MDLLFLHDADMDWPIRSLDRPDADLSIGVKGGITGLKSVFNGLLAEGRTFQRVMFYTHGNKGTIFFGDDQINAKVLLQDFTGYDALFPSWTRMYFAGCNVAEDEVGWQFLETAGKVFLRRSGGLAFGWNTVGLGVGGNLINAIGNAAIGGAVSMLIDLSGKILPSGKVFHPLGETRYVWINIGGQPVHRYYDTGSGVQDRLAQLASLILP